MSEALSPADYARAIQVRRIQLARQNQHAAISTEDLTPLFRDPYERWALTNFKIKDKSDQIRSLQLRPCQRRVGDVETQQLAKQGRSRIYVLKGRQGGISTDQQARNLHLIGSHKHKFAMTLADTKERSNELFGITRRAIMLFTPGVLPQRGPATTREVSFPELDSRFVTETAGTGDTTGIGLTLSRLHGSEFAHWKEPLEALAAVTPSLERPGTTIVLETTGSGFGSEGHDFYSRSREGGTGYQCVFIPWWECDPEFYRTRLEDLSVDAAREFMTALDEEEIALHHAHGLDAWQLHWRRTKIGEFTRSEFLRQYAEDEDSCWLSVGGMYYNAEQLKTLLHLAESVVPRETHLDGALEIYDDANGEEIIIGADTAEGAEEGSTGKNDRSTFTARAFPSWRRIASYRSDNVTPREFAGILATWGKRLSPKAPAFLVIEKNMHGITVLRHLRDGKKDGGEAYPTRFIYHRETLGQASKKEGPQIGWLTSEESKPIMLGAAQEMILAATQGNAGVPSVHTIKQALSVRRDASGKYRLNGKDDLVGEMLAWIGRSAPRSRGVFVV